MTLPEAPSATGVRVPGSTRRRESLRPASAAPAAGIAVLRSASTTPWDTRLPERIVNEATRSSGSCRALAGPFLLELQLSSGGQPRTFPFSERQPGSGSLSRLASLGEGGDPSRCRLGSGGHDETSPDRRVR